MFNIEYKEVDSITCGDTKYRLVESSNGKRVIQLYSNLSKRWNITIRYNVEREWTRMKRLYESMAKRRNQNKKALGGRNRMGSSGIKRKK